MALTFRTRLRARAAFSRRRRTPSFPFSVCLSPRLRATSRPLCQEPGAPPPACPGAGRPGPAAPRRRVVGVEAQALLQVLGGLFELAAVEVGLPRPKRSRALSTPRANSFSSSESGVVMRRASAKRIRRRSGRPGTGAPRRGCTSCRPGTGSHGRRSRSPCRRGRSALPSSRITAPMVVPAAEAMSSIIARPPLLDLASPWRSLMASAAPRRRLCTLSMSPRRTWVSRVPMVASCGLMAMSISPPCTRSTRRPGC